MGGMIDPTSPGGGGLLGNLFGGGDPNALYAGLLSDPATKRALAMRELAAAAGAAGEAAMPTRMPTPIGAVLGKIGGAMGTAGDAVMDARLKAAQAGLYGYQGQQIQSLLQMRKAFADELAKGGLLGTPGGDAGTVPGAGGPTVPTTGGGAAKAVASETADTTLPTEARALLDTISGPESAGAYNVRYNGAGGDATFDSYGAHPQVKVTIPKGQPYAGSTSDAAGRYQFLSSTFNPLAKQYGYSDFSPVTQDRAAWQLAQDTYAKNTGRNLLGDLQSGDTSRVAQALHGQWGTLNMANYSPNLAKYAGGGASPTQLAQAATGTATDVPTGLLGPQTAAPPIPPGPRLPDPRTLTGTATQPAPGAGAGVSGSGYDQPNTAAGRQLAAARAATAPQAAAPGGLITPGGANPLAVTGSAGIPQSLLGTLYPQQGSAAAPPGAPGGLLARQPAAAATPVAQPAPAPVAPPSAPAGAMPGQLTPAQLDHIQKLMIYGKLGGLDITDVLSNTPQYKAAVEAATKAAALPYTPQAMRPGSGISMGGQPPTSYAPTTEKVFNPTTQRMEWATVTPQPGGAPPTVQFSGVAAEASAQEKEAGTQAGRYQPAVVPGGPVQAPAGAAPVYPGAPDPTKNIQTQRGTTIPSTSSQYLPTSYPAYQEAQGKWQEWNDSLAGALQPAQRAEQQLTTIVQAFKATQSGATASMKANLGQYLLDLGVSPGWVSQNLGNVSAVQQVLHESYRQALTTLAAVNKRFTGNEFNITSTSGANIGFQPEANLQILSEDLASVRQIEHLAQDWNDAQTMRFNDGSYWTNPQSFVTKWYDLNPLSKMTEQVKAEIGDLKGQQPAGGGANAPSATPGAPHYTYDPRTRRLMPTTPQVQP